MTFSIWLHGFMVMTGLVISATIIAEAIKKAHGIKE